MRAIFIGSGDRNTTHSIFFPKINENIAVKTIVTRKQPQQVIVLCAFRRIFPSFNARRLFVAVHVERT